MKMKSEDSFIKEEKLSKVKSILFNNIRLQLFEDVIIKRQLLALFSKEINPDKISYPQINRSQSLLLNKLIDLIALVFDMTATKRQMLYEQNISDIGNKDVLSLIKELVILENFEYDISDNLLILYKILDKKEASTLYEYIDSVFLNLAFIPQCENLLKYQIYSYISKYYLSKFGIVLKFRVNEINLTDDISIKLIANLFEKNALNNEILVQSIVILNYDSLRDNIAKFDLIRNIEAIKAVSLKVNNFQNTSLCVERIMLIFIDELEMPQKLRNKIKDRKKEKHENNDANIKKKEDVKEVKQEKDSKTYNENRKVKDEKKGNAILKESNNDEKKSPTELQGISINDKKNKSEKVNDNK